MRRQGRSISLGTVRSLPGAMLLATALALSVPGVDVVAAGCDASAQSCDASLHAAEPGAAPGSAEPAGAQASCPADRATEAALAAHDAAVARLQRELAVRAGDGTPLVPLNGRGYNYEHGPTGEAGDAVLRFEAHPVLPPR